MAIGWKRLAERIAVRSGLPTARHRLDAPSAVILAYHNVVPRGEAPRGDLSLHIDERDFEDHLDMLVESHDVVPLGELFREPQGKRPRAVVTFDDAYVGAITAGLDALAHRHIPATVFVAPGLLGSEGCWWDVLSPADRSLSPSVREHALKVLAGRHNAVLDWAVKEGLPRERLPEYARPATSAELASRAALTGIQLGAHTWSHPNLSALSYDECLTEMSTCWAWLSNVSAVRVKWLAYPYGLWSQAAAAASRQVFDGATRVEGGLAMIRGRRLSDAHATARINVPRDLSVDGLRLRLANVLRG
jgi:peptidoglycan/xylan/chitin deacetylase (PgdA/CDA1 family)